MGSDYFTALVELIQAEAAHARAGERPLIRFAAFLFAACRSLALEQPEPGMAFPAALVARSDPVPEATSPMRQGAELERAFEMIAGLKAEMPAEELFAGLLSALSAVDAQFDANAFPQHLARSTALSAEGEKSAVLQGEVLHWLRGPSLLREARRLAREDESAPTEDLDPVLDSLRNLSMMQKRLSAPVLQSLLQELPGPWRPRLSASSPLARYGRFRVALCPLAGAWYPQFQLEQGHGRKGFTALRQDAVANSEELGSHLEALIDRAVEMEVRLLVFPELSLDIPLRARLREKIRGLAVNPFFAVVAGSFHVWADGDSRPRNEAVVMDGDGTWFWRHHKSGRYKIRTKAALARPEFFPLNKKHEFPLGGIPELIHYGKELRFLDTPLGMMALLICADALDDNSAVRPNYIALLGELRPDLVLVVSMSPKTEHFAIFINAMVKRGIGVLLVNAACVCGEGEVDLAWIDLALLELAGSPPTRWRWPVNGDPQWYAHDRKRWLPLSVFEGDAGVRLLGQRDGLVIDLAAALAPLLRLQARNR